MRANVLHPAGYHGQGQRHGFFEGWYLKQVDASGQHALAVIPGVSLDPQPSQAHSFVQVLDGSRGRASYYRFPLAAFAARHDAFEVTIGANRFAMDGLTLDLDGPPGRVYGQLRYNEVAPWPVTRRSPGAMGPFAYAPMMECYHGVLSFDHAVEGALSIDGQTIVWDGGRGYIEKDWGRSFPRAWIWMQSNHFRQPGASLMASVALIPWLGATFRGFTVGLWRNDRLLRWASYTGARIEYIGIADDAVQFSLLGGWGATRGLRLEIKARRAHSVPLVSPRHGAMIERVPETLDATIWLRLSEAHKRGKTLFEDEGRHAGLEVNGELAHLLR